MRLGRAFIVGIVAAVAVGMSGTAPAADAAPAQPACQIWATSQTDSHVTVINSHTSQVSSLSVNRGFNVVVTPDGSKVYVATASQGVKAIDVTGGYSVTTLVSSTSSYSLALSPSGDKLYVGEWRQGQPGLVTEYSTATNATTNRTASTGPDSADIAVSPDGSHIYVADYNSGPNPTVTKIATSDFTRTIHQVGAAGHTPSGLVVSPDGSKLFVTFQLGNVVNEIRTSDMAVLRTLAGLNQPRGIAINSSGSAIFVSNAASNNVVRIDTNTFQVTHTIPVGANPIDVAIAPDNSQLFVTNRNSGTVSRIDLATNTNIESIPFNVTPWGIAIGPSNCTTVAPQQAPAPVVPIWRVTMDPAGGECLDGGSTHDTTWTSVFVGFRYLPGASDCEREGYSFAGWADVAEPKVPVTFPLLVDPADGKKRAFAASNFSLVAVWAAVEDELDDLTGTAPGAFVGGPDRVTAEGGGVVDGYYIPPRTQFGLWMLAIRR